MVNLALVWVVHFISDGIRPNSLTLSVKCSCLLDYSLIVPLQCSEVNKELADDFCFAPVGKTFLMIHKPFGPTTAYRLGGHRRSSCELEFHF